MALLPDAKVIFSPMPKTEVGVWEWFHRLPDSILTAAVIEQVSGYIPRYSAKTGHYEGQPGSAMFKFGQSYGSTRMALIGVGFREGETLHTTSSQEWQGALGLRSRVKKPWESDVHWKNYLAAEAQSRFPRLRVTLTVADALLLAYYCRQKYGGG